MILPDVAVALLNPYMMTDLWRTVSLKIFFHRLWRCKLRISKNCLKAVFFKLGGRLILLGKFQTKRNGLQHTPHTHSQWQSVLALRCLNHDDNSNTNTTL
jgi:hypothetical protein